MMRMNRGKFERAVQQSGGLAGWLLRLLRNRARTHGERHSRLELLERIALAPRHSLALVEAEGKRFLVVTSMDGGSAFHALDELHVDPMRSHGVRASRLSHHVPTHSSSVSLNSSYANAHGSKHGLPRASW